MATALALHYIACAVRGGQQNSNLIKDERCSDSQTYTIRKVQSGVIVLASRENGTKKEKSQNVR
eukprot:6054337-Pleurochrysis_carterae.AAC.1